MSATIPPPCHLGLRISVPASDQVINQQWLNGGRHAPVSQVPESGRGLLREWGGGGGWFHGHRGLGFFYLSAGPS